MAGPGKKFEKDFEGIDRLDGISVFRIRDTVGYSGTTSLADYYVFYDGTLYLLELKSVKGISITVSKQYKKGVLKKYGNFSAKQFEMMKKYIERDSIYPGYIINFRKNNNTYFIHHKDFEYYLDNYYGVESEYNAKSIPETYCERVGIKLKQELKRTRYNYFGDFLKKIKESK